MTDEEYDELIKELDANKGEITDLGLKFAEEAWEALEKKVSSMIVPLVAPALALKVMAANLEDMSEEQQTKICHMLVDSVRVGSLRALMANKEPTTKPKPNVN